MARPEERNVPESAPPHRRAAPQELLFRARKATGTTRRQRLQEADARLDELRLYLRLAHHWHWLNDGQYERVGRQVAELGRLLGGWTKYEAEKRGTPG